MHRRPTLSLNEWAVLGVLADEPRHGYDVAAELDPAAPIGMAWRLTRPLVYRALERLEALGLVEPMRVEPGRGGPPRTVYRPTRRGRSALRRWLDTPVAHVRDVRSELLLKLVLIERLGRERRQLIAAQRAALAPVLERRQAEPHGADVIATWRHHSAAAVASFLADLADPAGVDDAVPAPVSAQQRGAKGTPLPGSAA